MISDSFLIQAFIALIIVASSLTSSVNAAPRFAGSERVYAPTANPRQGQIKSQDVLDGEAMSKCVPSSNPNFCCFNAALAPTSSGTVPFDTCANAVAPGPCFQALCKDADSTTIGCLNQFFLSNN